MPADLKAYSRDLLEVSRSEPFDLAIFQHDDDVSQNSPNHWYELSKSSIFSEQSDLVDLLSYIHGVWGESSSMYQHPLSGLLDYFLQSYTGFGPIIEVSGKEIIADFAEKEFVEEPSEEVKKRIPDFELSGGVRDISGCSGSGLWVHTKEGVRLLGILLGRKEGRSDEHLIRFTPVWKLIEFVEDNFDKLK